MKSFAESAGSAVTGAFATVLRAVRGLHRARDNGQLRGVYSVRCVDKDGNLKWTDEAHNLITNTALNDVLNEYIRGTTQTTTWYTGLVDNASFSAYAGADTSASHAGWIEFTAYSNATRIQWSPGAASSQSITNGSSMNFLINGSGGTVRGLFISALSTISGTTGLLFSEANFSGGNQVVANGDTLQVTYTLSFASA